MIPEYLPYRELSRDEIDTEDLTWFDYIIGRFGEKMWYEQYSGAQDLIDPMRYWPIPFPEEPIYPHRLLSSRAIERNRNNDMTSVEDEYQNVEELRMFPDAQCRFGIWLLYHYEQSEEVEALPKQENVKVPPLTDTVPSDVPLIFGPQNRDERSGPYRPFVRNHSEIPNFTSIADRRKQQHEEYTERKERQQRQDAQLQQEKRQKWKAQRQQEKRQRQS